MYPQKCNVMIIFSIYIRAGVASPSQMEKRNCNFHKFELHMEIAKILTSTFTCAYPSRGTVVFAFKHFSDYTSPKLFMSHNVIVLLDSSSRHSWTPRGGCIIIMFDILFNDLSPPRPPSAVVSNLNGSKLQSPACQVLPTTFPFQLLWNTYFSCKQKVLDASNPGSPAARSPKGML